MDYFKMAIAGSAFYSVFKILHSDKECPFLAKKPKHGYRYEPGAA